jgi:hypothetical protein
MLHLVHTLQDLQAWNVSLVDQSGLQFDLSTLLDIVKRAYATQPLDRGRSLTKAGSWRAKISF